MIRISTLIIFLAISLFLVGCNSEVEIECDLGFERKVEVPVSNNIDILLEGISKDDGYLTQIQHCVQSKDSKMVDRKITVYFGFTLSETEQILHIKSSTRTEYIDNHGTSSILIMFEHFYLPMKSINLDKLMIQLVKYGHCSLDALDFYTKYNSDDFQFCRYSWSSESRERLDHRNGFDNRVTIFVNSEEKASILHEFLSYIVANYQ